MIAGETEELGENLPQRHFVSPQIPHDQVRFRTPDRSGGKPATNRLSYGAALLTSLLCNHLSVASEMGVPDLQDGDYDNALAGCDYGTFNEELIEEYGALCGMVVNRDRSKKVEEELTPESQPQFLEGTAVSQFRKLHKGRFLS
jgi:hypothetical protein